MRKTSYRNLITSSAIYFAMAALIHAPVMADYLALPVGGEILTASNALDSPTLVAQVLTYFIIVAILNLLPLSLILVSFRTLKPLLERTGLTPISYFMITSLTFWAAALAYNGIYFPQSAFSVLLPFGHESHTRITGIVALISFTLLTVIPAAWPALKHAAVLCKKPYIQSTIGIIFIASIAKPIYSWETSPPISEQPDIIIIGIDSLSPLHLDHNPGRLGFFESLLRNATQFTNNITPLARTFPAWMSILTAQYPIHHGARFNLTSPEHLRNRPTLAHILQTHGYTTIYAQDERKFNNIDEDFGFDTTVGPQPGAAEFILTKISDHPLANLALLLPGSKTLFPFIALNRADHIHYDPEEFVKATLDELPDNNNTPIFLATHFCLAHYPYTWRTQSEEGGEKNKPLSIEQRHISSLASLQKQVDALLQGLQKRGRLKNTLLVLLSDHGESLGYEDALWPKVTRKSDEIDSTLPFNPRNRVSGHGGNILDRTQYHSVLAFRGFGTLESTFPPIKYNGITSLVDITPTILSALGITYTDKMDGINLIGEFEKTERNKRTVITETGISFKSMTSLTNLNEADILKEAQKYYSVEPESARLVLNQEYYQNLVSTKDIAIHTDDWMLALLRSDIGTTSTRTAILINKTTGEWTAGDDTTLIEKAPLSILAEQLKHVYADEILDFRKSWLFN